MQAQNIPLPKDAFSAEGKSLQDHILNWIDRKEAI